MTLQNHPGEVEFPARARVRYARMLDAQPLRPGGGKGTRALLVTALALPFGAAGVALGIVVATSGEPEGGPAMPIVLFAPGWAWACLSRRASSSRSTPGRLGGTSSTTWPRRGSGRSRPRSSSCSRSTP